MENDKHYLQTQTEKKNKKKTNIASLLLSLISSWETFNLEFEVTNKKVRVLKTGQSVSKNVTRKHNACDPMHTIYISLLKTWRKKSYLLRVKDSNRE